MVKHIILWKIREDLSPEEKAQVKAGVKAGLENLKGTIPGLLEVHVRTESLPSSNADLMLDSLFADQDSLNGYSVHPAHVEVADTKVRPYMQTRLCLDYEVQASDSTPED